MNKLWIGFGTIVVLLVAMLMTLSLVFPANSWRYRFTMEVETPEGVRTGFVVRQINVSTGMKMGDASGARMYVRGEALAIDLGQRGILFALIDEGNGISYDVFFEAFPYPGSKNGPLSGIATSEGLDYYSSATGNNEVPFSKLPTLVRFGNIVNPNSVEIIDGNDLAKTFGAGVKLKSAMIEVVNRGIWPLNAFDITGEPMTNKLKKTLPWLSDYPEPGVMTNVKRDGSDSRPEVTLIHGHFRRGL